MSVERKRTRDVITEENSDFSQLLISDVIVKGLTSAGYNSPSPIQLKTIPLGRSGVGMPNPIIAHRYLTSYIIDIIAQAKSGTGKTIVFSVIALEKITISVLAPQVIILAPTREIALQIHSVITKIGVHIKGLRCSTFIGGTSIATDIDNLSPCHIVVGTPGRIKQLIEEGWLHVETITLFILDEVDKMLGESSLCETTTWIRDSLKKEIQFLAFSATYDSRILKILHDRMTNLQKVILDGDNPSLEGVKQYYYEVPKLSSAASEFMWKQEKVISILSNLSFHQCLIFCNNKGRADTLNSRLNKHGWPTCSISSHFSQKERTKAINDLRQFKVRVLISSDLISRGLDVERVNLVINIDIPKERETYLHRIGRTGRFGTYGVAISFVNETEKESLIQMVESYQSFIEMMPEEIPSEFYAYELSQEDKYALNKLEISRAKAQEKAEEKDDKKDTNGYQEYDSNQQEYNPNQQGHNYGGYTGYSYWNQSWDYTQGQFWSPSQMYISLMQNQYIPEISKSIDMVVAMNSEKKRKRN